MTMKRVHVGYNVSFFNFLEITYCVCVRVEDNSLRGGRKEKGKKNIEIFFLSVSRKKSTRFFRYKANKEYVFTWKKIGSSRDTRVFST